MIKNNIVREAIDNGDFVCDDFGIQMTRRCNFGICPHCINGKPQEIDIKKEVVEQAFDNIKNINKIILLGGEVSLNPQGLEYVLNAIEKYRITFNDLRMASNGREFDTDFYDILNAIEKHAVKKNGKGVSVNISSDDYHISVYKKLDFDSHRVGEMVNKMKRKYPNINFNYPWVTGKQDLYEIGKAKSLKTLYPEFKDIVFKESPYEDMVFTYGAPEGKIKLQTFNVDVKGNIIPRVIDYEGGDKNNFGNLLKTPLKEILISEGKERYIKNSEEALIIIKNAESSLNS